MQKFLINIFIVFISGSLTIQNGYAHETFLSSLEDIESFYQTFKKKTKQRLSTRQEESKITEAFVQQALRYYQRGQIAEAIYDFSRALLIDPHHAEAQQRLIQLSAHPALTGKQKVNLYLLEDLFHNLHQLKMKIKRLEKKQSSLKNELIKKGYSARGLQQKMEDIENAIMENTHRTVHILENQYLRKKHPLEMVNASLEYEQSQMNNKLIYLQRQYEYLVNIRQGGWDDERPNDLRKRRYPKSKKPLNIYAQNFYRQDLKKDDSQDIVTLNKKVKSLTKQLVDSSLQLSEHERLLERQKEDIERLNRERQDLQSRLELGQRIIQEKEETIQELQQKQKKTLEVQKGIKEYALKKAKELKSLQEKLEDLKKKKEEEIRAAHQQLAQSKKELSQARQAIKEERQRVAQIMVKKDQEIQTLHDTIAQKEKTLSELTHILKSSQSELAEVKKSVDEKVYKIAALNKKINGLKQKLSRKKIRIQEKKTKAALKEKDEMIADLKKALARIKKEKDSRHQELQSMVFNQVEELAALKKEIQVYRESIRQAREETLKRDQELDRLHQQVVILQEQLNQALAQQAIYKKETDILKNKEKMLDEMEGILAIYRWKLKDAHDKIKKKDIDIATLTEQLNTTQAKLFEKNEMLKITQNHITLLEYQLEAIQQRLLDSKKAVF